MQLAIVEDDDKVRQQLQTYVLQYFQGRENDVEIRLFADGDEILIFVTELTANYYSARFIGRYGCDRYYMHNKQLQFDQRQQEIIKRMDEIQWTV